MSPNDFGNKFLVEDCRKVTMSEYLARAKRQMKEALLASEVCIFTTPIGFTTSHTAFGGTRHWFECPKCERRAGTLFVHPVTNEVGCRICLGLDYRKRRFKGMIETEI